MLTKLLKYEFKSTARTFGLFYAALIVLAVVTRICAAISEAANNTSFVAPLGITMFLYGFAIAAVCVMTILTVIQRFYKNLLQNEGYLMHTLPVKTHQHITSKLITSVIWFIASGAVVFISLLIVAFSFGGFSWSDITSFFSAISYGIHTYGLNAGSYILAVVLMIVLAIVYIAATVLQLYASMAVGQVSDKHKVLCSFAAFVGFNIALQIIDTLGMTIIGQTLYGQNMLDFANHLNTIGIFNGGLFALILLLAVRGTIFYFITHYFMKNKLNLE